jgi:hypothetical protein
MKRVEQRTKSAESVVESKRRKRKQNYERRKKQDVQWDASKRPGRKLNDKRPRPRRPNVPSDGGREGLRERPRWMVISSMKNPLALRSRIEEGPKWKAPLTMTKIDEEGAKNAVRCVRRMLQSQVDVSQRRSLTIISTPEMVQKMVLDFCPPRVQSTKTQNVKRQLGHTLAQIPGLQTTLTHLLLQRMHRLRKKGPWMIRLRMRTRDGSSERRVGSLDMMTLERTVKIEDEGESPDVGRRIPWRAPKEVRVTAEDQTVGILASLMPEGKPVPKADSSADSRKLREFDGLVIRILLMSSIEACDLHFARGCVSSAS